MLLNSALDDLEILRSMYMKQLSSELGTIDMSDFFFTTISIIKERKLIYKGKRNSYFTSPTVKFFFHP